MFDSSETDIIFLSSLSIYRIWLLYDLWVFQVFWDTWLKISVLNYELFLDEGVGVNFTLHNQVFQIVIYRHLAPFEVVGVDHFEDGSLIPEQMGVSAGGFFQFTDEWWDSLLTFFKAVAKKEDIPVLREMSDD